MDPYDNSSKKPANPNLGLSVNTRSPGGTRKDTMQSFGSRAQGLGGTRPSPQKAAWEDASDAFDDKYEGIP